MIALHAKQIEFDVTYINLREKPDWFLAISPHGKVPVLKVGDAVLFESNAIAEYLDEADAPRLHPGDLIERARNRAWTDHVGTFAGALSAIWYAGSAEAVAAGVAAAPKALAPVEQALAGRDHDGPFFNGAELSLVDAAYAPFLQRLAIAEAFLKTGLLADFPHLQAWSDALLADERVTGAVPENFPEEFVANHKRRESHLSTLMLADAAD